MSTSTVSEALGVSTAVEKTVPVSLRLPETQTARLDAIEAYARGQGERHVNRSSLIRAAVGDWLDRAEQTLGV